MTPVIQPDREDARPENPTNAMTATEIPMTGIHRDQVGRDVISGAFVRWCQ